MKAGDKVWAITTVVSIEPNGVIYGDWDMHDPACVIPHTEELPAVARWLADMPELLPLHLGRAIEQYIAHGVFARDMKTTEALRSLRALLAALTEETA